MIQNIFKTTQYFEGDIFGNPALSEGQAIEIKLRESVAGEIYEDYLLEVSRHHSVPVMDAEVLRFLEKIPHGGLVCDVGGCWGWHWRNIANIRPDVNIVIVDFIRPNLLHARTLLANLIGNNVYLVHGDATNLEFKDSVFDGFWTVQTFQHIPNLVGAVKEAHRVLE
jgi:ubiquinone/menaquinone biosynthesis C-methylase UbiE